MKKNQVQQLCTQDIHSIFGGNCTCYALYGAQYNISASDGGQCAWLCCHGIIKDQKMFGYIYADYNDLMFVGGCLDNPGGESFSKVIARSSKNAKSYYKRDE